MYLQMENPAANQLPEADSLPDGFVESAAEPLAPSTPTPEQEKPVTDYKEEKLLEPDLGPKFVVNDFQSSECDTVQIQKLRTFPVALSENDTFDALQKSVDVINEDHIEKNEDILVVGVEASSGSGDAVKEIGERLGGSVLVEEQVKRKCQSSEIAIEGGLDPQPTHAKVISSVESVESNKKTEASEVKRKNAKRTFKSEKEFLEFTLKYQQVLAERDGAIAVRDKLESLCRELQRQNKMLMDECKRVSTEGQNLRLDLSTKFQDAIKGLTEMWKAGKCPFPVFLVIRRVNDFINQPFPAYMRRVKECTGITILEKRLRIKLKQFADQYALSEQQHSQKYALSEQQHSQKLKQKTLELQIAELKIQQHEEKLIQEQSQMKLYAEQVSQLLATEKNLRLQLTADGEKFQQFQTLKLVVLTKPWKSDILVHMNI
ncbi:unnamed protein product [Ilex paraguariensis]|uniref:Uncharacterized protein n=1 Tax=Ilex paraguariensis TaxID=185542 RepID=A0ABC8S8V3_9AQUA